MEQKSDEMRYFSSIFDKKTAFLIKKVLKIYKSLKGKGFNLLDLERALE